MTIIADMMSRDLLNVEPDTSLTEAAQRLAARSFGATLVFDGDRLIGILTERDVLRAVAAGSVEGATVSEWMTRHPETIEPSDTTGHAAAVMIHGGFRHLPVVEAGKAVGMVSIRDLMRVVLDDEMPRGA